MNKLTYPFAGQGVVSKYLPTFFGVYEKMYSALNQNKVLVLNTNVGIVLKINAKDTHLAFFLKKAGRFEETQTKLFIELLANITSGTIFDIGANVGYYACLAGHVNPKNKVYAFEPDIDSYRLLVENVSLNNLDNVTAVNKAIFSKSGPINFKSDPVHRGASHIVLNKDYKKSLQIVDGITIDDYCETHNIKTIEVLKLDVEGSEVDALAGGKKVISQSGNIHVFIEYNPKTLTSAGKTPQELMNLLANLNLTNITIIDEPRKSALSFSKENLQKIMGLATYCNFLCTKPS